MERLFYSDYEESENLITIEGDEFKHARALRLMVGSEFIALSGDGLELRCRVIEIGEGELKAEVEMHRRYGGEPPLNITLAQSFLKKGLLREALSMAIQAGISGFIPLITERVIGKREGFDGLCSGLRNVARASIKQCGRSVVPEIYEPMDIPEMIESFDKVALRLVLCIDERARPVSSVLSKNPPESILLVVGPEGGFSGKEINLMIEGGFSPVIISPRRIKSELAGVLATTEILYNYGEDKKKEERWNTVSSVR